MPSSTSELDLQQIRGKLLRYAKHIQDKCVRHPYWMNRLPSKITNMKRIVDVDIGEAGCFKYVLIEVRNRDVTRRQSKLIVRGDASCTCHGRIYR
jgi:hypothetical protein